MSLGKKIGFSFLGLVVVVIGALLVIPFFYSIDNLRPQIQQAAEKQVHGKVELGKLSLKLFPEVRVEIDGVKVTPDAPYSKEPLATIGKVAIRIPLASFLSAPRATLLVDKPAILLISKGESSNLTTLLPAATPEAPVSAAAAEAPAKSVDETLSALPAWIGSRVKAARFTVEVKDGSAEMRNLLAPKGDKMEVKGLEVQLADMGLNTPMEIQVAMTLDMVSGDMKVSGGMKTSGKITATPAGKGMKIALDVDQDLSALDARMSTLFHKKPGVAFNAGMKGTVLQGDTITANFSEVDFRFGGFKMMGSVDVENAADPLKASVKIALKSGDTNIGPFAAIVPMIGDFKLDGKFSMALDANGSMMDPRINMLVKLADVTGSTPQLKKPVSNLTGTIQVEGTSKNPTVKIDPMSMKIASSDMSVKILSKGLENISAQIQVSSKRLDADELMGLEALKLDAPAAAPGTPGAAPVVAKGAKVPPPAPLDETLNQMAPMMEETLSNPMLDKISATIVCDFKSIKALGAEFNNATFNMAYAKRDLKISKTGIGAYGGRMDLSGSMQLQPKAPAFDFHAGLGSVNLAQMIQTHAPSWKDVLTGTMTGEFAVSGKGFRKEQLNSSLAGGLKGDIHQGHLKLPVTKLVDMIMTSIPKGLGKQAEVQAKDKEHSGDFKTMKLVSVIKGRNVELQDLDVTYLASGVMGEMRFQAKGNVNFDQQVDIAGMAYLPPEVIRIAELKGPSGKIEIPLKVKGSMVDPKPDLDYSLKILGPRIAQNAIKGRAGAEAKKALAPQLDKLSEKAPEPVKKGIQDLRKKFKF